MKEKRICKYCGKDFLFQPSPSRIKTNRGKFCSRNCGFKSKFRPKIHKLIICPICNKEFLGKLYSRNKKFSQFCSKDCLMKSNHMSQIFKKLWNNQEWKERILKKREENIVKKRLIKRGNDNSINLLNNNIFMEVINGLMLSDAHISKDGHFSLTQKYEDIPIYLNNLLEKNNIKFSRGLHFVNFRGKRLQYFKITTFKDQKVFEFLREKWYPYEKKIVPDDLKLTSISVAYWFMGDGTSQWIKPGQSSIRISTEGFIPKDVDKLIKLLNEIGIENVWKYRRSNSFQIGISKSLVINHFFDMIESYILPSFKYKIRRSENKMGV